MFVILAVGCAPADVAGNYAVNLTSGDDGCAIAGWTVGEMISGVSVIVVQDDDQTQLDVEGPAGTILDIVVGSSLFNGQVGGNGINAALIGDNTARMGECVYTYTIDLDADVNGDFMEGQLRWHPVTNGHADCGILETCFNLQSWNGSRPPRES